MSQQINAAQVMPETVEREEGSIRSVKATSRFETITQLPTRHILAGVFIASLLPFLVVETFHHWLYHVMDISGFLVFHNFAEFFSVMVSLSIFGVGWFTYEQSEDRHVLFLSATFLAVGLMDFMHALGYAGMPPFITPNSVTKASQYWIAARLFDASAFLASAFIYPDRPQRWLSKRALMVAAFAIPALIFTGVTFFPEYVPTTFIPGVGLTPFKKISEYLIICLLILASVAYWQRMVRTGDRVLVYYLAAFIICIFSELVFTFYKSIFDTYNVLGHIYKILAFYLIYKGIFTTSVNIPYEALRKETLERLRTLEELHEKNQLLAQQSRQAAMGEMINNIAHQWRQPLNTLGLLVQQAPTFYELGEVNKDFLDTNARKSMELIQHMSRTIDDFRNFFKPGKEKVLFKVQGEVAKTLSLMEGSLQQIDIEVEAKEDPAIHGYPNEFGQVLLNILNNARDALTEREIAMPKVLITIGTEANRAVVTIADNAGGIPEEIIGRIFDPYFTTKGPQEGTGVGLFMSKAIIEKNMGGRLTVRNVEDGAEFKIEV